MVRRSILLLCVVALAAGCGGGKHAATTTVPPVVLPQAQTPDIWARRIVDLYFRALNKDLQVLNGLNSPQVQLYIASQNPTTLRILKRRLADLAACTSKLITIGPPPQGHSDLDRIYAELQHACTGYVQVAQTLQKATEFLASGRTDVIQQGLKLAKTARAPSGIAADHLVTAVRLAEKLPAFRRAGLKPSV